jgi:hypothetical protein
MAHQSNGQSNPLSRSWNRWYLMTGAELGNRWQLHLKAWQRMKESALRTTTPISRTTSVAVKSSWAGTSTSRTTWA